MGMSCEQEISFRPESTAVICGRRECENLVGLKSRKLIVAATNWGARSAPAAGNEVLLVAKVLARSACGS